MLYIHELLAVGFHKVLRAIYHPLPHRFSRGSQSYLPASPAPTTRTTRNIHDFTTTAARTVTSQGMLRHPGRGASASEHLKTTAHPPDMHHQTCTRGVNLRSTSDKTPISGSCRTPCQHGVTSLHDQWYISTVPFCTAISGCCVGQCTNTLL